MIPLVERFIHTFACGAGEFVVVHAPVCLGYHLVEHIACLGIGVGATVAVAHGSLTIIERRGGKRSPASLEPLVEHLNRIGYRDEHELVAAYAVEALVGTAVQLKAVGDLDDVAVACWVSKMVVADFKTVDIDIGNRVFELSILNTCNVIVVGGAVGQARERIDVGIGFELHDAVV